MKKVIYLLVLTATAALVSCSSDRSAFVSRKYTNFKHTEPTVRMNPVQKLPDVESIERREVALEQTTTDSRTITPSNLQVEEKGFGIASSKKENKINRKSNPETLDKYETEESEISKDIAIEEKQIKYAKERNYKYNSDLLLQVILSILIPPLAVYLKQGAITSYFWIDIILWCIFLVPGMIFALLVVFDVI